MHVHMHIPCHAHATHTPCTCTSHAHAMHVPCTSHAVPCACHARAMHTPCTCHAHPMHLAHDRADPQELRLPVPDHALHVWRALLRPRQPRRAADGPRPLRPARPARLEPLLPALLAAHRLPERANARPGQHGLPAPVGGGVPDPQDPHARHHARAWRAPGRRAHHAAPRRVRHAHLPRHHGRLPGRARHGGGRRGAPAGRKPLRRAPTRADRPAPRRPGPCGRAPPSSTRASLRTHRPPHPPPSAHRPPRTSSVWRAEAARMVLSQQLLASHKLPLLELQYHVAPSQASAPHPPPLPA